jgi:hypothetical protein
VSNAEFLREVRLEFYFGIISWEEWDKWRSLITSP